MTIGVTACALMVLIGEGDIMLASVLFFIGNIGVSGSTVFYDSLLPHVATPEETDRVSSAGYAMGYISGGVLLLHQPRVDPATRRCSASPTRSSAITRVVRRGGDLVGGVFDPAVPECAGTAGGRRPASTAAWPSAPRSAGWPGRSARSGGIATRSCCSSRCCSTRTASRRIIRMVERLRRGSRHRPERADRRVRDGAVRRHSVLVPVRIARRAHRHQALHLHRDRRLHRWPRASPTS